MAILWLIQAILGHFCYFFREFIPIWQIFKSFKLKKFCPSHFLLSLFLPCTKQRYFAIKFLLKLGYYTNGYFGYFWRQKWLFFQNLIWSPWTKLQLAENENSNEFMVLVLLFVCICLVLAQNHSFCQYRIFPWLQLWENHHCKLT